MLRETAVIFIFFVIIVHFDFTNATMVVDCQTGDDFENNDIVKISSCDEPPCELKRDTNVTIELKFIAPRDIRNLRTKVNAEILTLRVPFIGVDGSNACDLIYNSDRSKAGCPLRKGVEYLYINTFPILRIYPTIRTNVRYALTDGANHITCFEVPATIS